MFSSKRVLRSVEKPRAIGDSQEKYRRIKRRKRKSTIVDEKEKSVGSSGTSNSATMKTQGLSVSIFIGCHFVRTVPRMAVDVEQLEEQGKWRGGCQWVIFSGERPTTTAAETSSRRSRRGNPTIQFLLSKWTSTSFLNRQKYWPSRPAFLLGRPGSSLARPSTGRWPKKSRREYLRWRTRGRWGVVPSENYVTATRFSLANEQRRLISSVPYRNYRVALFMKRSAKSLVRKQGETR